jgi:hypothetical protein
MTFIPMFTFVRSLPAAFLHAWLRGAGESFGDSARIIRRGGPVRRRMAARFAQKADRGPHAARTDACPLRRRWALLWVLGSYAKGLGGPKAPQ